MNVEMYCDVSYKTWSEVWNLLLGWSLESVFRVEFGVIFWGHFCSRF